MPAKDRYHDTVKRALMKDGWTIVGEQVYLSDNQRHIWIDMSARHETQGLLVLIEIKGFESSSSLLDTLMSALSQYAVYSAMLEYLNMSVPLYLAVPDVAHKSIFQAPVAQKAIRNLGVRLLVFDPVKEEVVQWMP